MSSGPFSPLMITAMAGLLDNTAMAVPADLASAILDYQTALTMIPPDPPPTDPVLLDTVPAEYIDLFTESGLPTDSLTNTILAQANRILPPTDLSQFCQVYNMCQAYRATANETVNSSKNSDILDATFTNMDALSTGGITQLTNDPLIFGTDLLALGQLIDLRFLDLLGYPSALLQQILNVGNGNILPGLYDSLRLTGISAEDIALISLNPPSLDPETNLKIYRALMMVIGNSLDQVKKLLDVDTNGITTAADLLNPKKILPNGYATLSVEPPAGYEFISQDFYKSLSKIIPPEQALDNAKLIFGFKQIKNIQGITFTQLGKAISLTEKPGNIGSGTVIPQEAKDIVSASLATGTGPDGTLTLYDFIGSAVGYITVDALTEIAEIINSGTYESQISKLENLWNKICDQISLEITNLNNAEVRFGDLSSNSKPAVMSVSMALHSIGLDVAEKGANEFFSAAVTDLDGGKAIVGSFKEGRNIKSMLDAGLAVDSQLDSSSR